MPETKPKKNRRIFFLEGLTFFVTIFIIGQLFNLQILNHSYYETLAKGQHGLYQDLIPERGEIFVEERESDTLFPLATNRARYLLYAVPKEIEDPEDVAEKLVPIFFRLDHDEEERAQESLVRAGIIKEEELEEKRRAEGEKSEEEKEKEIEEKKDKIKTKFVSIFSKKEDPYEPLRHKIDEQVAEEIKSLEIRGLEFQEEDWRYYPEGTLAAHILGFVGFGEESEEITQGRYGVEGYYNEELKGKPGFLELEKDVGGRWISVGKKDFTPAENGWDIVLTIDRIVQNIVEDKLVSGAKKYQSEEASVVVLDPKTGAILALANYPTFDPNYYSHIKEVNFFTNSVIFDLFEPGSVFKPIVMAAAMDIGKVTSDTTVEDDGPVRVANYTIDTFDGKHHGTITMTEVLEQSNNVGMVKVAQMLGAENLYDYIRRFGFGELMGVPLESETGGRVKPPEEWNITNVATVGFGQGIAVTPIQLASATAVIANQGELMQPYIVDRVIKSDGEEIKTKPKKIRQVISKKTSLNLSAMLVSAVENGVASPAQVRGYHFSGKTGTAQVPQPGGGYYGAGEKKITSYVGFGPIEDPCFVILVVFKNPERARFGASSAAPLAKEIIEELVKYYKIPPSEPLIDEEEKLR